MNLIDPELVAKYPYLDLSEADLQSLFDKDKVLQNHHVKIAEYEDKLKEYDNRMAQTKTEIDQLIDKRSVLEAALKANDTETREARGRLNSDRFHQQTTERRMRERASEIARRQKVIFHTEVNRRLAKMGRELKLNTGIRAAKGLGAAILETKQSAENIA